MRPWISTVFNQYIKKLASYYFINASTNPRQCFGAQDGMRRQLRGANSSTDVLVYLGLSRPNPCRTLSQIVVASWFGERVTGEQRRNMNAYATVAQM
jgi:hypothetical protein